MKNLTNLTEIEIILEIFKCDQKITKFLTQPSFPEFYPGEIMGLGDFYCEKHLLLTELLRRRSNDSK